MRFIPYLLAVYLIIMVLAYWLQDKLIYFPDKKRLADVIVSAKAESLTLWPSPDARYRGFLPNSAREGFSGTVVIYHGNAGSALDRLYYAKPLELLGYRVILSEYPGYGARVGNPGELSFRKDAVETIQMVYEAFGGPVYIWGESLGCGVAAAAVSQAETPISGMILLTPWDTLPNVAQAAYWFLPVKYLVKDKYDNIRNLENFQGPIAVIKAGKDEIIPNRLTENLYKSITGPKKLWSFDSAGHNTWPSDPHLDWWREVMDFVKTSGSTFHSK